MIQTLLRSLGINPDELLAHANALTALVQSIDKRLELVAQQNALIITMMCASPSGPPHPSPEAQRLTNGSQPATISADKDGVT
jgi:hypothetical protein